MADEPDECFGNPRLAEIYDALDPDRGDLDPYLRMAEGVGARRVLDIGCGTGVLALLLADRGIEVVGVDPAGASLDVARGKPGAERVRWIRGDATALPPLRVDLATMTANVAQAIVDPQTWRRTLRGAYEALRPGGHLVFETRAPARRAWEEWNRETSYRLTDVPGVGAVEYWVQLTEVHGPLVSFRQTYIFTADSRVRTTDDGRFRRLTLHLPPAYAQRLFDARNTGASDQEMRGIIAEGFKEIYFQDGGGRALGISDVTLNDIDYLDLDY